MQGIQKAARARPIGVIPEAPWLVPINQNRSPLRCNVIHFTVGATAPLARNRCACDPVPSHGGPTDFGLIGILMRTLLNPALMSTLMSTLTPRRLLAVASVSVAALGSTFALSLIHI